MQPGQDFRPPPHWDAGFEFSDGAGGPGGAPGDYSDFFEQLFGRAARARGAGRSEHTSGRPPPTQRGADHHARIELDLADAYQGAERTLTLQSAHQADDGSLVRDERHLAVKIPQGVREGQLIRLAGQGSPGWGGAPAGDLFLEVLFKPDPRWRAEGRDVYQPLVVGPLGGSPGRLGRGGHAGRLGHRGGGARRLEGGAQAAPQRPGHPGPHHRATSIWNCTWPCHRPPPMPNALRTPRWPRPFPTTTRALRKEPSHERPLPHAPRRTARRWQRRPHAGRPGPRLPHGCRLGGRAAARGAAAGWHRRRRRTARPGASAGPP